MYPARVPTPRSSAKRAKKHTAAAPPPAPPALPVVKAEQSVSGTTNTFGRLLVEYLDKLTHEKAFGVAGNISWGEWERLSKTDPHIAMALSFVCDPIRDAEWDIEPPEDSPNGEAMAEFLEWNLAEVLEPGFDEVKEMAARGALASGFALFERVVDVMPSPRMGGKDAFVLRKLSECLPSSVISNGWLEGPSLDLERIHQRGTANDGTGKRLDIYLEAQDVLLFSWQRQAKNYQGISAFRPVYFYAKVREMLAKLIGVTLQREGAGIPVASTADRQAKLPDSSLDELEKFLANLVMHESASIVMPPGWTLEWVYSSGANKGHVVDAWNALGLVILQLLGAQQMVLGVNGTGSRSVGEVHHQASANYVNKVCAFLTDTFNGVGRRKYTGVIKQLVDLNFGVQQSYPKLVITPKLAQLEPGALATAAKTATDGGLFTPTLEDENVLRKRLGFSPIDEETRDAEKAKKVQAAQQAIAAQSEPGQPLTPSKPSKPGIPSEGEREKADPDAEREETQSASARKHRAAFVPGRPLRASEVHLATQEIADFLDTARDSFERLVKPEVMAMLVRAEPAIHAAMASGDAAAVAAVPLDTKRLEEAVQGFIDKARTEGARQVRGELARAKAARKNAAAAEEEEDPPPGDGTTPDVTAETDDLLTQQRAALMRRITTRLRADLENEAIEAQRTGDDADAVVSRAVQNQLNTGAFRNDAGLVTAKAWNLGRDEAARLMGSTQVEYSAIMDSATCDPCAYMDGERADVDSPEHDAMVPPNRDCDGGSNCRCLLTYVPGPDTGTESDDE